MTQTDVLDILIEYRREWFTPLTLSEMLNISLTSIQGNLKKLRKFSCIEVEKAGTNKKSRQNRYRYIG